MRPRDRRFAPPRDASVRHQEVTLKKFDDIVKIAQSEVSLIKEQSGILLQKQSDGFNGELKTSGYLVESYIKDLLKKQIPGGYRLCSGYISTPNTINGDSNLTQHDIIIVDERVAPIYVFGVGDIEVVAAESVCGIFEIKRTLSKSALSDAIEHLKKTKLLLDEYDAGCKSKENSNNLVGPAFNPSTAAPIYGIISLDANTNITKEYVAENVQSDVEDFIDIIWAIAAPVLIRFQAVKNGQAIMPSFVSRNQEDLVPACAVSLFDVENEGKIYKQAISCIRVWINNTTGKWLTHEKNNKYYGLN